MTFAEVFNYNLGLAHIQPPTQGRTVEWQKDDDVILSSASIADAYVNLLAPETRHVLDYRKGIKASLTKRAKARDARKKSAFALIRSGPKDCHEIAEELGISPRYAYDFMVELQREGKVRKLVGYTRHKWEWTGHART